MSSIADSGILYNTLGMWSSLDCGCIDQLKLIYRLTIFGNTRRIYKQLTTFVIPGGFTIFVTQCPSQSSVNMPSYRLLALICENYSNRIELR